MWHLDSNIVVAHFKDKQSVRAEVTRHAGQLSISAAVLAELLFGARKSARPEANRQQVEVFANAVDVVPFDRSCAECYSRIRESLERRGQPIGELDMLIAATALAYDATLVTHNKKHFERVEGLRVEDWLSA